MIKSIWIAFAIVGAGCSICYQLGLAKILAKLSGDVMIWESLSTGVFLLGMGLGSFQFEASQNRKISLKRLLRIEFFLALVGLLSPMLIYLLHLPYRIYVFDSGLLNYLNLVPTAFQFAGVNLFWPCLVGYISGFELPLLLQMGVRDRFHEKVMLAAYYVGALLGTLVFVWAIHPHLDSILGGVYPALFNLLLILGLLFYLRADLSLWRFTAPLLMLAIAFTAIFVGHGPVKQVWLANFFYNRMNLQYTFGEEAVIEQPKPLRELLAFTKTLPYIEQYHSRYREIDVVRDLNDKRHFSLHLDGHFQMSSRTADDYHEHFVHVPATGFGNDLESVLVLGGGDGLVARELLKYNNASITLVDLDEQVIDLSRRHVDISALNAGALDDERVSIVAADAFTFLMKSVDFYDAILIDFTYPFDFDSARLFSAEFFALIKSRLNTDGWAVAISPVEYMEMSIFSNLDEERQLQTMVEQTIAAAGFDEFLVFSSDEGEFLAFGKGALQGMVTPDLNVTTKVLTSTFFGSTRWKIVETTTGPFANRLMKPTFRGVEDTFF